MQGVQRSSVKRGAWKVHRPPPTALHTLHMSMYSVYMSYVLKPYIVICVARELEPAAEIESRDIADSRAHSKERKKQTRMWVIN